MEESYFKNKIESLTFYGINDETYEYWQKLCKQCYNVFHTYGSDRALMILSWIQEDAIASYAWVMNTYGSTDEVDLAKGVWHK